MLQLLDAVINRWAREYHQVGQVQRKLIIVVALLILVI